ncbi:MAG: SRPBCC family protein [Actinomycetota bacterium]
MAKVEKSLEVNKPADEVWALIGDFHGLHKWIPNAQPSEAIDDGKRRKIQLGPNAIIEGLAERTERSYTYTIDEGPLPVSNYRSTLSVDDAGDGKSVVSWVGTFEPAEGATEESAVQIVNMIYDGGLAGLQKTLDG